MDGEPEAGQFRYRRRIHIDCACVVMALLTIKPTKSDVTIARAVARNTNRRTEKVARALTWAADEKLLLLLAGVGWLATRNEGEALRRTGFLALVVSIAASLLPHAM